MKLLLTSSGCGNPSLRSSLVEMLGQPIEESTALLVPTGAYPFPGGPFLATRAITGASVSPLAGLGWKQLGVLEPSVLPSVDREIWEADVRAADAILVWGGNPVFLAYWMRESGLGEVLADLDSVYVGVSAGSICTATVFAESMPEPPRGAGDVLSIDPISYQMSAGPAEWVIVSATGMGLTDFAIIPHYENPNHEDAQGTNVEAWAARMSTPVYAIDDQSAVRVVGGSVDVVSEGQWHLFNGSNG